MNLLKLLKISSYHFTIIFGSFCVLNILSHYALSLNKSGNPVLEKYGLDKLAEAYPGYTKETVKEILDETWSTHVVYSSYVQFREPPKKGKHVNISPAGFRQNNPFQASPFPLRPDAFNIFVFGGSTTFGYGVRDNETIPAYLESLLKSPQDVRVYNFGRAFYFSTQERILFEQMLLDGSIPDAVIFIDGLNEFYHTDGNPTYTGFLNGAMDNSFYAAQKKFFREMPVVNFARYCRNLVISQKDPSPELIGGQPRNLPNQAVIHQTMDRYVSNVRIIKALTKEYGIRNFFVWQPVPEYYMDLSTHPFYSQEDSSAEANRAAGYSAAKRLFNGNLPEVIWAAELSPTCSSNFIDKVHYSASFNRQIAAFLTQAMSITIESDSKR